MVNNKLISQIENKKPVEEIRNLEEQELSATESFISPIFNYGLLRNAEELHARLSGVDKKDVGWRAREVQKVDMPNYKKLLANDEVMRYYRHERPWMDDEIETQVNGWVNSYKKEGCPLGALTISSEQGDFVGYILVFVKGEGIAEMGYALSPEYWGRGIGYSVLSKTVGEWGSEVRRVGLGVGFEESNEQHQKIKKKFQCFKGKELRLFYATVRPVNISSWHVLEKAGFKPAEIGVKNMDVPINFDVKGFDLPSSDDLFKYYSKIEYYIEKLYRDNEIEVDELYYMIDGNSKLYTFSKKSDGRIRFHYEKEVS